jgi:hypothetical protein
VNVSAVNKIDIKAEVAKVQGELLFFRERILPALFETPVDAVFGSEYGDWVREKSDGRLSEWQEATRRLAELLPLGPLASSTISSEDFREFLVQEATSSFCVRDGRIIWQVRLFVDSSLCSAYFPNLDPAVFDDASKIQRWLMSLPVDSLERANGLCMVLPLIADADPAFAKLTLDPEEWRGIVLADRHITEEQRAKRLKCVESQWFAHVLNNSLLHTLGALANNHFMMIEDFLEHPNLVGGYTHLMPHYLFAVLFEKVAIHRQFSVERPELW